ncbi:MAG: hypothetical protein DI539_28815 [Flavobacterium psychrophilum]|nr:MAG: hypothetical protein DI539_28815 [Flavobacterium psychrophilum]
MPPLFFLLGFKGFEELMTAVGLTQNTILQPMKLVDKFEFKDIDLIAQFLKSFEGFESKAYDLKDGRFTLGYGQTNWLTPAGGIIRPVRLGDSIDESNAHLQLYYYYIKVIPSLNLFLFKNGYKLHPRLVAMLVEFLYGTGPAGLSYSFFKNICAQCNNSNDEKKIASIYLNETIKYLKEIKGGVRWIKFGLGWSRRRVAATDYIKGELKPKIWYDRNIRKPL